MRFPCDGHDTKINDLFTFISFLGFVHLNSIISLVSVLAVAELDVKGRALAIERLSFMCPEMHLRLTIQFCNVLTLNNTLGKGYKIKKFIVHICLYFGGVKL